MLVTACQDRKYQYADSSVREKLGNFTKKKEHLCKKMEVSNYTSLQLAGIFFKHIFWMEITSKWPELCLWKRQWGGMSTKICVLSVLKNFLCKSTWFMGKKNIIKRLVVLLVTTTSFNNFTYFEFSKLLELTGQNENAFLSEQIKVTFEKLNHYFQVILWQNMSRKCAYWWVSLLEIQFAHFTVRIC